MGHTARAQDYFPGELTLRDGTTRSGQVALEGNSVLTGKVRLRTGESETPTTYSATEVDRLTIDGQHYRGGVVEVEQTRYDLGSLTQEKEWQLVTDTVFLRTVVSGDRALYVLDRVAGADQFYVPDGAGGYTLLRYKRYLKTADLQLSSVRERRDFVRQLADYLTDCPGVRADLQKLDYELRALRRLYTADARCRGVELQVQEKRKWVKRVRAGGGFNLTDHNFQEYNGRGGPIYEGSGRPRPTAFIGVDLLPDGGRSTIGLSNEVSIVNTSNQPVRIVGRAVDGDPVQLTYLKYSFLVQGYPATREGQSLLLGIGFSAGLKIGESGGIDRAARVYDFVGIVDPFIDIPFGTRDDEYAGLLQVGYRFGNYIVEARGELATGGYANTAAFSNTTRLSVLVSYLFD